MADERYRSRSLWLDEIGEPLTPQQPLTGDATCDVAIVGGGLHRPVDGVRAGRCRPDVAGPDPRSRDVRVRRIGPQRGLGVCVVRRRACGHRQAARPRRRDRAPPADARRDRRHRTHVHRGVDRLLVRAGRDAHARDVTRARRRASRSTSPLIIGGASTTTTRSGSSREEARGRVGAARVFGAAFTPHCAAIQPARLARGLADAVRRRDVTRARGDARPRHRARSRRDRPRHRAGRRSGACDRGLHAATGRIGAATHPALLVHHRYRTAAAIVLGRRGLAQSRDDQRRPSSHHLCAANRRRPHRVRWPRRALSLRFRDARHVRPGRCGVRRPRARDARRCSRTRATRRITHRWGGPLGVPRDWYPSVGLDRSTGLAWAGGYVGDGVTTTNLAGRTLADLILRRDTERTELAWVDHHSRDWEREPLRWLGVNAGLRLSAAADRRESRTRRRAVRYERALAPSPEADAASPEADVAPPGAERGYPYSLRT